VQDISNIYMEDVFKLYLTTKRISMDKEQNNILPSYAFLSQFAMGRLKSKIIEFIESNFFR